MGKAERDLDRLRQIVKGFPDVRILVVGDVMLDEFVW
jgi:bifunctional ADP-heptose synthase (sugar kinase/adenylyltransferase)